MNYDLAHELFIYDSSLGRLRWKLYQTSNAREGELAGSIITDTGYRTVMYKSKNYREHRVIWLMHHGYLPECDLDHINRCRSDNRIENLREVSRSCNSHNCKMKTTNTSGITGVHFYTRKRKWVANIMVDGRHFHLGYFDDKAEAIAHRFAIEQCTKITNCIDSPAKLFMEDYVKHI